MGISVDDFIKDPQVIKCLGILQSKFGQKGERLIVSDVVDQNAHQYVHLVQKGGGVLGVALIGYTYILEQMNIRFIRLAGTSAGAINTALMTVIGGGFTKKPDDTGKDHKKIEGDKTIAKSIEILNAICNLDFFNLVDGHPAAQWFIKKFITNKEFTTNLKRWVIGAVIILFALPVIDFICFGLQKHFHIFSYISVFFFLVTGVYVLAVCLLIGYIMFLLKLLKNSGFGINPGDYFYDWIKERLIENNVHTVSDLINKSASPVDGLEHRDKTTDVSDLTGDVTFIASELISQNKIEFPKMWNLFRNHMDMLQPAGFIRASMSIPIFFESYFINDIPCTTAPIIKAWGTLGEPDPPSSARFVDGGIISNFPINLFYNPNIEVPRLPSFGIDLDDTKDPATAFNFTEDGSIPVPPKHSKKLADINMRADEGKHAPAWSFTGYLYRIFNTVRFYYDKDFLIKNAFYKKGIGVIPLKGYGWLNFALTNEEKKQMFAIGAKAATQFLLTFDWEDYKDERAAMHKNLMNVNANATTTSIPVNKETTINSNT